MSLPRPAHTSVKIALFGAPQSGKSTICNILVGQAPPETYVHTDGFAAYTKNSHDFSFQITDCGCSEQNKAIEIMYGLSTELGVLVINPFSAKYTEEKLALQTFLSEIYNRQPKPPAPRFGYLVLFTYADKAEAGQENSLSIKMRAFQQDVTDITGVENVPSLLISNLNANENHQDVLTQLETIVTAKLQVEANKASKDQLSLRMYDILKAIEAYDKKAKKYIFVRQDPSRETTILAFTNKVQAAQTQDNAKFMQQDYLTALQTAQHDMHEPDAQGSYKYGKFLGFTWFGRRCEHSTLYKIFAGEEAELKRPVAP